MRKGIVTCALIITSIMSVSCRVKPEGPWHPERTDYPRTIYKAHQLESIKARLDRYPYNVLYGRVVLQADSMPALNESLYDPVVQYSNANIAKSAAFIFAVKGNGAYRQKAVDVMKAIPQKFGNLSYDLLNYDIHIAESLMCYAQALDILIGAGALDTENRRIIEEKLGSITEKFFDNWAELICNYYELARNNHHTKTASAFGMVAIVLNNHPMAKVWIDYAMNEVESDLNSLVTDDGGYAEGPNYWTYSAVNILPFAWAYHLFNNGQPEAFVDRPCLLGGLGQKGTSREINDFFEDWKIRAVSEWMIKIRQPDGLTPPIDDANLSGYFNAILAGAYREAIFSWDWMTSSSYLTSVSCADISVDIICIYDDSVAPVKPSFKPSMIMEQAGQAVMRSGWDASDSYVLLQAENGKARISGYGHEHPDALNFMFYAKGIPLIIDSGYINYPNHDLVRYADNHNIILVNGKGPEPGLYTAGGADAFFRDFITTEDLDYCSAYTEFSGVRHDRSLVFPDREYLIVSDKLSSKNILPNTYGYLLHGNGGGSTGGIFEIFADTSEWINGNAKLKAVVVSPEGMLKMSSYDDYHGFVWGVKETHSVLKAELKAKNARYLAILYPVGQGETEPDISHIATDNGAGTVIASHGTTAFIRSQAFAGIGETWSQSGLAGYAGFPSLRSDAGLIHVLVADDGSLKQVFLENASTLDIGGTGFIKSSADIVLSVSIEEGVLSGGVIAAGGTSIEIRTGVAPVSVEGDNVSGYSYLGSGMTRITFSGQGEFAIYLNPESALERLLPEPAI